MYEKKIEIKKPLPDPSYWNYFFPQQTCLVISGITL